MKLYKWNGLGLMGQRVGEEPSIAIEEHNYSLSEYKDKREKMDEELKSSMKDTGKRPEFCKFLEEYALCELPRKDNYKIENIEVSIIELANKYSETRQRFLKGFNERVDRRQLFLFYRDYILIEELIKRIQKSLKILPIEVELHALENESVSKEKIE